MERCKMKNGVKGVKKVEGSKQSMTLAGGMGMSKKSLECPRRIGVAKMEMCKMKHGVNGVRTVESSRQSMILVGGIGMKAAVGMFKGNGRRHFGMTMVGRTMILKLEIVGGCALGTHGQIDRRIQNQMRNGR